MISQGSTIAKGAMNTNIALLFVSNVMENLSRRNSLQFQLIAQTVVNFNSWYELERGPEHIEILYTSGLRTPTMDSFADAKYVLGMTRP